MRLHVSGSSLPASGRGEELRRRVVFAFSLCAVSRRLLRGSCAQVAVAKVAQAGENVVSLVEALVHPGADDADLGESAGTKWL